MAKPKRKKNTRDTLKKHSSSHVLKKNRVAKPETPVSSHQKCSKTLGWLFAACKVFRLVEIFFQYMRADM